MTQSTSARLTRTLAVSFFLATAACSSTAAPAVDTTSLNGDAGGVGGNGSLSGTYGSEAINPVVAAYWVGKPTSPDESAGGPFVYLFSTPVTCDQLSTASAWVTNLPAGAQALEAIIGTTTPGAAVSASPHAGANVAEVNYFFGHSTAESRATTGTVTLTSYTPGVAVDGVVDVAFPSGNAKGSFHATWCPGGHER
jgi:hypothetical protein